MFAGVPASKMFLIEKKKKKRLEIPITIVSLDFHTYSLLFYFLQIGQFG